MAKSGTVVEPQQRQFLQTQGPVARKKSQKAAQILRAGNALPGPRGNPVNGGPGGGRHGGRGGNAVPADCAHPLAALWFLSARAERNSPPRRRNTPLHTTNPIRNLSPHPPQCEHWGTFPPGGRLMRADGEISLQRLKPASASNTSRYKTAHTERPPPAYRYTRWCRRRRPPRGQGR